MLTAAMMMMAASPLQATPPAARVEERGPAAQTRVGQVSLHRDRKGRPMIAVEVNGRGPFDMVVDTAAQISLVTPALATELALPRLSSGVSVNGATGATDAPFYGVDRLSSPLFDLREAALPALPNSGVTDARGILGIDVVAGRKLTFDLAAATLSVGPSAPPAVGFVAIRGRLDPAGLLIVPVTIDGRQVDALVDTGAEGTVAGAALLDLLGWQADDPRVKGFGTIGGAGGAASAARVARVGSVQIGPARLSNVPIVIAPGATETTGARPQVILGVNLLDLFSAFAVDFGRAELQVRSPSPATKPS